MNSRAPFVKVSEPIKMRHPEQIKGTSSLIGGLGYFLVCSRSGYGKQFELVNRSQIQNDWAFKSGAGKGLGDRSILQLH